MMTFQYPGDSSYPSVASWHAFNNTLGGKLIAPQPAASVCYSSSGNSSACQAVVKGSLDANFVAKDPIQVDWPWWSGNKCPASPVSSDGCHLGNYSNYVVRAESAADVSLGVKFAAKHNLRLVVKNTGHDFLGR
jgi:hypothetical protein